MSHTKTKSRSWWLKNKVWLMVLTMLISACACLHKSLPSEKISEAPKHRAPDQEKIDSIKSTFEKHKK